MLFDLHAHTTISDGRKEPSEVASLLKYNQYRTITDHNRVGIHMSPVTDLSFPGIELIAVWGNVQIEVLCYGFNPYKAYSHPLLECLNSTTRESKIFNDLYARAKELGYTVTQGLTLTTGRWACRTLFDDLVKYEENIQRTLYLRQDSGAFYRYTMNPTGLFFVDSAINTYPSVEDVKKFAEDCGGMLFLAHPFAYAIDYPMRLKLVEEVGTYVNGIECLHTSADFNDMVFLTGLAKSLNLHISGGSDYHGDRYGGKYIGTPYLELIPELKIDGHLEWMVEMAKKFK